jgi:hypothetical protein
VVFPRGVPHALCVTSKSARLLCLQTPGSGEAFYLEASEPATSENASGAGPVDFVRLQRCAKETGSTEILGPPPFSR